MTTEVDPKHVEEGKSMAWLSYLGILFLIPMFTQRQNPYTMFHVRQGIVLFVLELAGGVLAVLLAIVGIIIQAVLNQTNMPFVSCCVNSGVSIITLAVYAFALVMSIIGIVKALGGQMWTMPVLGGIAGKIKL